MIPPYNHALIRPATARLAPDVAVTEYAFRTEDDVELLLTRYRRGPDTGRAILLLHGMTASSDLFVLPECVNLVETLHANGWHDVWSLDWRASMRLPYLEQDRGHQVDDVALYDLPSALAQMRGQIGDTPIAVFCHCVGSLALALGLASGTVHGLAAVASNSVFLTPSIPIGPRLAALAAPSLVRRLLGGSSYLPTDLRRVGMFRREALMFAVAGLGKTRCSDPSCHLVNFAWGAHPQTLFEHHQLCPETHDRLPTLLGSVPLSYFSGFAKMVAHQNVLRVRDQGPSGQLSDDALSDFDSEVPLLLLTGTENQCWYDSQSITHTELLRRRPGMDVELIEVPGYGHLDTIIGKNAALDVFPRMLTWLEGRVPRRG